MSTPLARLTAGGGTFRIIDLPAAAGSRLERMPHVHRILLENVLRTAGEDAAAAAEALIAWPETGTGTAEIPFMPGRVLMHDTTCGPALVDIAGLRSALEEAGGDPARLNPVLPVDVSTDHSLAVDAYGTRDAFAGNMAREYARNGERYRFMKWATNTLSGLRVHPPGTGIMHTLNLERLASVVTSRPGPGGPDWAMPDTLIGTDSHTPMINGIGVLGWGVGGLEAESVMFGLPAMMRIPDVVGVRLTGALRPGVLATDLALAVTERLRRMRLDNACVEFFGPGVATLSAGERAVVANMTPEFGGATGFFPVDAAVLRYLRDTGRPETAITLVERFCRRQGLWFDPGQTPRFTESLGIALDEIGTSVAGPFRPQDRLDAGRTAQALPDAGAPPRPAVAGVPARGAVALAAITSCTNTSDPRLLLAAGLLARKARLLGLAPPPWVKTSLAPGSPTARSYLQRAGLLEDLEALGFAIVGYGCTTCIGNAGPLGEVMRAAMAQGPVAPVAVLSGNRNFPGRVHADIGAAFLASPPLVVAFALAGDADRDILNDPLGAAADGTPVRLADLWPSGAEIDAALDLALDPADVAADYARAEASATWEALEAPATPVFPWDGASTYIRRPPFARPGRGTRLGTLRVEPLLVLGDDITTDHISPAGQIAAASEAGRHLAARGADPADLNVFASRRGNFEVMLRGLFTNKAVRNLLDPALAPGETIHAGSGEPLPLWQAAERYAAEGRAVAIVAGERYGMGSSRDWAAKGVALLGVSAVLAASFERIHRANLIGMGILPLLLPPDTPPASLALRPGDTLAIAAEPDRLQPRAAIPVAIWRAGTRIRAFAAVAAIETAHEVTILREGGILPLIFQRARQES